MLERLLKWASAIVFARYKVIALLFFMITSWSAYLVYHMEIKTDLIDVLPRGNPTVSLFKDFTQKYNVLESVTVIISSESKNIDEYVDLVEALAERFKQSPLIENVDYTVFDKKNDLFLRNFPLFLDDNGLTQLSERLTPKGIENQIRRNYEKIVSPVSSPADIELIERDPLGLSGIVAAAMKRSGPDNPFDLSLGYYITKDHSTALVFVKPAGRSRDIAFVKNLRPMLDGTIKSTLAEYGNTKGISVQLTGGYIFSDDMRRVIRHDILTSTLLSVVLIAVIIWLAYRVKPIVLLIVACTTTVSLSMTLAAAYLIFGSLNIVTSIVCGLLIGMYVDYCILTLKRFGDEMLLKQDRWLALQLTMTKAGAAMIISALTTAISFFSIVVTKFDGLYELGIVSGIGVLICFFVTFLLMNSLLVWASKGGADSILYDKTPSSGVELLSKLMERYPRRIVFISLLIIIALMFGISRISFDSNPEHIGIRNSQAVAAMRTLHQKLNISGEPLQIMIRAKDTDELTAAYDRLEIYLTKWKKEGLIARADSLASLVPPPAFQKRSIQTLERLFGTQTLHEAAIEESIAADFDKIGMSYNREMLSRYALNVIKAVSTRKIIGLKDIEETADLRIAKFYNRHDLSMVAYLYPAKNNWNSETIESIRAAIVSEGNGWTLFGSHIIYGEIKNTILWGSSLATLITLALNLLIVVLFLGKSRKYVVVAMLPVCLGFLLTPAIMGWLGAPFNFINIGTMALIFGFGVDYGLYIMQAYLREDTKDINNALQLAGKNVMMCAATTIAGCGSLITAEFAGIASIGLVLTIGAVCCSTITIILLPSMLWLGRKGNLVQ
ncbi:MAG TPA: MMPL family transporter [Dissulfurispiraceae bacterium]|nr:MMPL family transporter [Dissulfurispiraceae bacterium]